ncbi:ATP-binding protein [Armatimonas sp.]|uniref:ATP-binding protein n=1 Tax=Armatimonas sp. TaxID=1872638 RepID=UPI0037513282
MSSQLRLFFDEPPTLDALLKRREDQWFERKSIRIEAIALANTLIGFANADGGRIAIGVSQGEIEGVDNNPARVNDLLQAAIDYTDPPVRHGHDFLDCTDRQGDSNRLLILDVEASERVHRNKKQECYLRIGDETRRLSITEERELLFDKGEAAFDENIVPNRQKTELDWVALEQYATQLGASSPEALARSRRLYLDYANRTGMTQAGWLLFGIDPPIWSYIRYLRYAGTTIETGTRSNVLADIRLEGTIPTLIEQAQKLLDEKVGSVIRLTQKGNFTSVPTLPRFAYLEAIVNAVTHRSYSLQGTGILIRDFEDRIEVESPGRLPGLVRVQNIRKMRYSRNPHIARVLAEMTGYVRELNEGVQRMFEEMAQSGLPAPEFRVGEASVCVLLYKGANLIRNLKQAERVAPLLARLGEERLYRFLSILKKNRVLPPREIVVLLDISPVTARSYMRILEKANLVHLQARSPRDPFSRWEILEDAFWEEVT